MPRPVEAGAEDGVAAGAEDEGAAEGATMEATTEMTGATTEAIGATMEATGVTAAAATWTKLLAIGADEATVTATVEGAALT